MTSTTDVDATFLSEVYEDLKSGKVTEELKAGNVNMVRREKTT